MKYKVEILEQSSKIIEVEAESEDLAIKEAQNKYVKEEVVLTAVDMVYADFNIIKDEE